ncbi:galactosylceramide sulfotransferase-like [Lytechinus pictus]|uniref:galactosylceramide sulfotransferase-like n=1 Tax=Lytechinus pictus TaxID=7653 RepID=UPI0030B9B215
MGFEERPWSGLEIIFPTENNSEVQPTIHNNCTAGCCPQHRIVFIKTHKTASSTTASILERYGYRHNLSFAVRPAGHIIAQNVLFHRSLVADFESSTKNSCSNGDGGFDMLTNHARYNRPEMEAVVHHAKYLTILREPTAQFESAFGYFHVAEKLGLSRFDNPIEEFMKNPETYLNMRTFDYYWQSMKNQQLFDLGLDHKDHDDEYIVDYKIQTLEKELDLVMLTEYFPESIVLLKKLLCWDFNDMLYMSNGVRSKSLRYSITPELRAKIRNWNCADAKLYDHFNQTFWKKVREYGPDFDKDLATFLRKQQELENECIDLSATQDMSREIVYHLKSNASTRCKDILRGDVDYTTLIQDRMRENGQLSSKFSFTYLRDVYNSIFPV